MAPNGALVVCHACSMPYGHSTATVLCCILFNYGIHMSAQHAWHMHAVKSSLYVCWFAPTNFCCRIVVVDVVVVYITALQRCYSVVNTTGVLVVTEPVKRHWTAGHCLFMLYTAEGAHALVLLNINCSLLLLMSFHGLHAYCPVSTFHTHTAMDRLTS